jgi:hypothetical protein
MTDRRLGWLGAALLAGGVLLMAAGAAVGGGAPLTGGPGGMMVPGGMMGGHPHADCWRANPEPSPTGGSAP